VVLQLVCLAFLVPAVLVCLYYAVLALYALVMRQGPSLPRSTAEHSFAILIPAHNEEAGILTALHACADLDYPKDRYQVFVIADNCTDQTAKRAIGTGATCLERSDAERRGKGAALEWAFERILPLGHDAFVILDADCRIDRHALRVFDQHLTSGADMLQANDVAANPDDSVASYALAVGNLIENRLFYAPKSRLGLAVFLRGTGVVLHRKILEQYPWQAASLTEDTEFTLRLLRDGHRVRFVSDVAVSSDFPSRWDELHVQRVRWATGNMRLSKLYALRLLWEGLCKRHASLFDAGCTLLVLSRPLVLLELALALLLSLCCVFLAPGPFSTGLFATALAVLGLQISYFALGVALLGINPARLGFLCRSPLVILRLLRIALGGILRLDRITWARTPRPSESTL
jgi:cellulose synthase/poly-beta-1,6-N-acetylglucosamine synthase-like glycosyltransferase